MLTGLTGAKRFDAMAAELATLRQQLSDQAAHAAAQIAELEAEFAGTVARLEAALDENRTATLAAEERSVRSRADLERVAEEQASLTARIEDADRRNDMLAARMEAADEDRQRRDTALARLDRRLDAHVEDTRIAASGLAARLGPARPDAG